MIEIIASQDRIVRNWASDIDEGTVEQAKKLSRSAVVAGPVALMPDAHVGIGATIGSVICTDSAIIPAAAGVDLGCGVIAVETDLRAGNLPDDLGPLLGRIERVVPAGWDGHDAVSARAAAWMRANPLPEREANGDRELNKAASQLGSLGGGNHYLEVCVSRTTDRVWFNLHSGSRGIGNILASRHIKGARDLCAETERALEDPDLAYFLDTDAQFGAYIEDMLWAQRYALENREAMMDSLIGEVRQLVPTGFAELDRINCHHNYTRRETHQGRELWVTRKGAIHAGAGARGVIPGSMGTATYVVTGLGSEQSYCSASHGAGRRLGRKQAHRQLNVDDFAESMAGRTWQADKAEQLLDEAPMAYKDIDQVMVDQADLVAVDDVISAVLNFKGTK